MKDGVRRSLPWLTFGTLFLLSYKRWILPFQDHSREMEVAARLLSGEVLYRDVGLAYGPLPAYLDAAALAIFGRSLDVLIAIRVVFALLGVAALHRLVARRVRDPWVASTVASFVVAAAMYGYGSAWPFPYSAAALEGTVGVWWAVELALGSNGRARSWAAACVGGLAAGTKLELLPAALGAVALGLLASRPRREAAAAFGGAVILAGVAWGGPVLLFGADVLARHGYLIALHDPEPWKFLQSEIVLGSVPPRDFLWTGVVLTLLPSALYLGGSLLVLALLGPGRRGAPLLAVVLGALGALVPRNEELHALLPFAGVLGLIALARAAPRRGRPVEPSSLAEAALALPMLAALAREPLFLRFPVYSAFAAPLALAFGLTAFERLPRLTPARLACFVAGLTAAQMSDRIRDRLAIPMTWVALPHASFYVPSETAPLVTTSVAAIERLAPKDGWIAGFPEGGLLVFVTERRSPFVDAQFHPGVQDAKAEDEMIARLATRPLSAALQTNQVLAAWGHGEYRHGVLDRFFRAFDARLRPEAVLGLPQLPIRRLGAPTSAVLYVPAVRPSSP